MTEVGPAGQAAPLPGTADLWVRPNCRRRPRMSVEARGTCHVAPGVRAGPGSDASSPQRPALSITSGRVRRIT
jgi:hypothetical protein